jgi:hypothetical protein
MVRIRAIVTPEASNRALQIVAESGSYYRSSMVPLLSTLLAEAWPGRPEVTRAISWMPQHAMMAVATSQGIRDVVVTFPFTGQDGRRAGQS